MDDANVFVDCCVRIKILENRRNKERGKNNHKLKFYITLRKKIEIGVGERMKEVKKVKVFKELHLTCGKRSNQLINPAKLRKGKRGTTVDAT